MFVTTFSTRPFGALSKNDSSLSVVLRDPLLTCGLRERFV